MFTNSQPAKKQLVEITSLEIKPYLGRNEHLQL